MLADNNGTTTASPVVPLVGIMVWREKKNKLGKERGDYECGKNGKKKEKRKI